MRQKSDATKASYKGRNWLHNVNSSIITRRTKLANQRPARMAATATFTRAIEVRMVALTRVPFCPAHRHRIVPPHLFANNFAIFLQKNHFMARTQRGKLFCKL